MNDEPRGETVCVVAPPKAGKSHLLWHQYASRVPRLLTIEVVRETHKFDRTARVAYGYRETANELADCAELGADVRWHVIAYLDRDEIEQLFRVVCPELKSKHSISFARAVGGLAILCGELAYMAQNPLSNASPIKEAYLRYRHHWLSIFGGTQHAPDADPCTRKVDRFVCLRPTDELGMKAVARETSSAIADRATELPQYHSITWIKSQGIAYVADAAFRVYDKLNYRGVSLLGSAQASPALSAGVALSADQDDARRLDAGLRLRRA